MRDNRSARSARCSSDQIRPQRTKKKMFKNIRDRDVGVRPSATIFARDVPATARARRQRMIEPAGAMACGSMSRAADVAPVRDSGKARRGTAKRRQRRQRRYDVRSCRARTACATAKACCRTRNNAARSGVGTEREKFPPWRPLWATVDPMRWLARAATCHGCSVQARAARSTPA